MNSLLQCFNFIGIFFFALLSGCDIINPEEGIPSYIYVNTVSLETDSATQGSNSHKITDVWIYVDDELLGAFELPAKAPVLANGKHTVKILAGIKSNGIAATRIAYPFYAEHVEIIDLQPKQVHTIMPTFKYTSYSQFKWIEDFEGASFTLSKSSNSDTVLIHSTEEAANGTRSGKIAIDETRTYFEYTSASAYQLFTPGRSVYLEMDYKSTVQVQVGIFSHYDNYDQPRLGLFINPSVDASGIAQWNKIYVNLTNAISSDPVANNFSVYFAAVLDTNYTRQHAFIDNIKVVTQ